MKRVLGAVAGLLLGVVGAQFIATRPAMAQVFPNYILWGKYNSTTNKAIAVDSNGKILLSGAGGGLVDGSGAATQLAVWSDADTLTGTAFALSSVTTGHLGLGSNAAIDSGAMNAWSTVNAVIGIQNNRTTLPGGIQTNIFNSNDLTPAADIVGARRHTGMYNDVEFLGTHNAANTEFYGVLSDVSMIASGTALWAFGEQAAVYIYDNMGNISQVYGANHYIYTQSTAGNITDAFGVSAYPIQHYGGGTVTNSYGVYVWPVAGTGTITNNIAYWSSAQAKTGVCSYDFWADEAGVYAVKADNTFDSVYQSSPRLYNPQFTKYTPCATNHERVVLQWESNEAVLTTEKGGTGTLRALKLGDAGVQVKINASAITLGGSFTTSGASALTLTTTGATNVTLPTSGTLATLAGAESLTNKKLGSLTTNGLVTTSGGDGTLGITAPGTGVLTALAVNVGSAGAFVTFNGAGGTPTSLDLTNATKHLLVIGAIMAGDSSGINPADATTYYFGPQIIDPTTSTDGGGVVVAPVTGIVKAAYCRFLVNGTLASAGSSTLAVKNVTAATSENISTSFALTAANNLASNTAMTLAVTAGDDIQFTWLTPTWATNPTLVYQYCTLVFQ